MNRTKVITVKSAPVQVGPGQHMVIETSAVHVLSEGDLKLLLKLMGEGYELKGTFVWGDMTIALVQIVRPSTLESLTINDRRPIA